MDGANSNFALLSSRAPQSKGRGQSGGGPHLSVARASQIGVAQGHEPIPGIPSLYPSYGRRVEPPSGQHYHSGPIHSTGHLNLPLKEVIYPNQPDRYTQRREELLKQKQEKQRSLTSNAVRGRPTPPNLIHPYNSTYPRGNNAFASHGESVEKQTLTAVGNPSSTESGVRYAQRKEEILKRKQIQLSMMPIKKGRSVYVSPIDWESGVKKRVFIGYDKLIDIPRQAIIREKTEDALVLAHQSIKEFPALLEKGSHVKARWQKIIRDIHKNPQKKQAFAALVFQTLHDQIPKVGEARIQWNGLLHYIDQNKEGIRENINKNNGHINWNDGLEKIKDVGLGILQGVEEHLHRSRPSFPTNIAGKISSQAARLHSGSLANALPARAVTNFVHNQMDHIKNQASGVVDSLEYAGRALAQIEHAGTLSEAGQLLKNTGGYLLSAGCFSLPIVLKLVILVAIAL